MNGQAIQDWYPSQEYIDIALYANACGKWFKVFVGGGSPQVLAPPSYLSAPFFVAMDVILCLFIWLHTFVYLSL